MPNSSVSKVELHKEKFIKCILANKKSINARPVLLR